MQLGSGFILGFFIGFALKKGIKILALLITVGIVVLFILEYYNLKSTSEDQIIEMLQSSKGILGYGFTSLKTRIIGLEIGGGISAIAGFVAGFRLG